MFSGSPTPLTNIVELYAPSPRWTTNSQGSVRSMTSSASLSRYSEKSQVGERFHWPTFVSVNAAKFIDGSDG